MLPFLSRLSDFLGSARGLVLLLALALSLPMFWSGPTWLDNRLFAGMSYFSQAATQPASIAIIDVPEDTPTSKFNLFVTRLAAERLAGLAFIGLPANRGMRDHLRKSDVQIGMPVESALSARTDFSTATRIVPGQPDSEPTVQARLLNGPPHLDVLSGVRKSSSFVPLGITGDRDHKLVWLQGKLAIPDLVLRLYVNQGTNFVPRWYAGKGLLRDDGIQISGPDGRILVPTANKPNYDYYTSTEFDRNDSLRLFTKQFILLGHGNFNQLEANAHALNALLTNTYVYAPAWGQWLLQILILTAVLYLIFALKYMRLTTGLMSTGIFLGIILIAQMGALLLARQWLVLTPVLPLLLIGHALMLISLRKEHSIKQAFGERDAALYRLGVRQLDSGEYDEACKTLTTCEANADIIEKLYEIGIEFERQRRYDKAYRVYLRIAKLKSGYRDVATRLESLAEIQGKHGQAGAAFNAASTLVIPSLGLEHPVLGRYELRRELGRGAMGIVYLGHDPKIVRDVAIKTIDLKQFSGKEADAIKSRFFREAEAAGRLSHPNVVTVYDVGDEHDLAFIAMDYVPGHPLSEYTHDNTLLDPDSVYKLIGQAAQALDYAHRQGIIHRDIKPGNILYNEEGGRIKVSDFGIARVTDTTTTRTGTMLGSPSYMAPEQFKGGKVDGRADIFSLGVTLYQLLCGELPFKGDNLASLAQQIINKKHRSIREIRPEIPVRIVRIINKALQKKADKRFASAQEMADALARA